MRTFLHKLLALAIGMMWAGSQVNAQKLIPLSNTHNQRTEMEPGYTDFPFYEDFSIISGMPDTTKWIDGSGVYVNLHYGIGAPTLGVATFDGLDATGTPYAFESPSALGLADELASKMMDLSSYSPSDEIFIDFYWQSRGWGEQPNQDDSLILEFKDQDGEWIRQWGVSEDTITQFKLESIPVANSRFLHSEFQFRFINYGRLSGPYDTWNIDYIYMNTRSNNSRPNAGIVRDIGFGDQPPQWLRTYSQMPLDAFIAGGYHIDTLSATLRNVRTGGIGDNVTHLFERKIYGNDILIFEEELPTFSKNSDGLESSNGTIFLRQNESIQVNVRSGLVNISSLEELLGNMDSARIEQRFFLFENSEDLNAVNTKANDTLLVETKLGDAFAYDDGSAELGWGINKKFGKFAVEFDTEVEWEMDAVDIYIARVGRRLTEGGFRIGIWQSIDTASSANDNILLAPKYYPISYTDSINEFQRFALNTPVTIPVGKFYVVIEQLTDELLPIGFDVQTDRADKLYTNLSDVKWRQNEDFRGSLMIRPVKRTDLVTSIPNEGVLSDLRVYPNPSNGTFSWNLPTEKVEVYNSLGQIVNISEGQSVDLGKQPKGLYLIRAYWKGAIATRRVLLR